MKTIVKHASAILILFAVGLHSELFAQSYPAIHSSRPRIYLDSARIDWLQNNYTAGECGTTYTAFRNAVYANWYNDPQLYLLGADSTVWTWDFNSQWANYQSVFVPSLYKISGDPLELKRCRFLIDKINTRFDTLNFANYDWYTNEGYIRDLSDMGGILLDWCYDDIPVAQRQHLARNLYKVAHYFMDTYITSASGNSYVSSHNAWNCVFANQYALVLSNADGLTPLQQDTVQQWYEITYDKFENGFLPVYGYYRDDDGGWNWTAAYSIWSLTDQFQFFENMRIATGADYYHDLPWVENSINQYWHFFQPDGITINWGDGFTRISSDRVIYRHAQIFNDPRSKWLAQKMSIPANITWTWPRFQILIYKDFTAATISEPDPPHDWFSDKTGLSVSRTGWDSAAAVVWTYNAPTKKSSHDHRDNNTFCVVKNKPQIIHSGYYNSYGNSHYVNYYQRTIAHNSICVFDSADAYTNWGVPVSNDGGQIESPTLMNYAQIFSPDAQKGKWILWGSESQYCYTIADAALSYDSAKLDTFMRRTFFHKPDRLLVLDHLHLRNTATAQRDVSFILHFQNQPAINGNLLNAQVPGHIEKFDGADVTQTNGNGNVAIRTLLPQNASITRVGGAGYEYYVNGVNYPVGSTVDSVNTTPGKWRIETRPPATVERPVFFHTIKIGDNVAPSSPGGVLNQTPFTIGADWENTLYFFSASGDTSIDHHMMENVPGGRTVEIVAADLLPNWAYGVFVDGIVQSTLIADTNGVCIGTLAIAPGTHVVELFASLESIDESVADLGLTVYPNPAGDEFTVGRQKSSGKIALQLIDAQGKVWMRTTMKEQLIISSRTLPSGIYFLEAEGERGKQVLRVVIAH